MQGAREYATLIKTGQYGNLYITSGEHARGKTFHIQILPDGEKAKPSGNNLCLNDETVEVYGIISGQPGWTETYGWKHKGPWQDDFEKLVVSMRLKREDEERMNSATTHERAEAERKKVRERLDAYVSKVPEITK